MTLPCSGGLTQKHFGSTQTSADSQSSGPLGSPDNKPGSDLGLCLSQSRVTARVDVLGCTSLTRSCMADLKRLNRRAPWRTSGRQIRYRLRGFIQRNVSSSSAADAPFLKRNLLSCSCYGRTPSRPTWC